MRWTVRSPEHSVHSPPPFIQRSSFRFSLYLNFFVSFYFAWTRFFFFCFVFLLERDFVFCFVFHRCKGARQQHRVKWAAVIIRKLKLENKLKYLTHFFWNVVQLESFICFMIIWNWSWITYKTFNECLYRTWLSLKVLNAS